MSVCVLVFIGLPGSGKTTLAKKLENSLKESGWVMQCVTYDDLISLQQQKLLATSEATEGSTKNFRSLMKVHVENVLNSIDPQSRPLSVVIVDDNNYYRSMRYEFYQLAADYSTGYLQIFIDCSVEDACQSNKCRPVEMQVPDDVIHRMKAKLETPRENWENTLTIARSDADRDDILEVIRNRILRAVKDPVMTKKFTEEMKAISEADRAINRKNVVHNADQILRKLVSETIQRRRNQSVDIRLLAKNLNEHRQKFMMNMKQDDFSIPQNLAGQNGSVDIQLLNEWIAPKFLASFQDAYNMLER